MSEQETDPKEEIVNETPKEPVELVDDDVRKDLNDIFSRDKK